MSILPFYASFFFFFFSLDELLSPLPLHSSMDHYETLGLSRIATKEEIKEAFRRSALNFHPDRHAQASDAVKQRAILRFKQASEAYEVLVDDRKRADYDLSHRHGKGFGGWSSRASHAASAGHSAPAYGGGGGYPRRPTGVGGSVYNVENLLKFITMRGFLMSLTFASLLIGGAIAVERSVDSLWKYNNTGKSFEDAMESIEKVRVQKDDN